MYGNQFWKKCLSGKHIWKSIRQVRKGFGQTSGEWTYPKKHQISHFSTKGSKGSGKTSDKFKQFWKIIRTKGIQKNSGQLKKGFKRVLDKHQNEGKHIWKSINISGRTSEQKLWANKGIKRQYPKKHRRSFGRTSKQ